MEIENSSVTPGSKPGSTTEESKLDDHKTWTYQLAVRLSAETGRKVEIINSALSGVRAEQNYYALRESESYSPDIALFIMGGNDWDYAIDLANSTAFRHAVSSGVLARSCALALNDLRGRPSIINFKYTDRLVRLSPMTGGPDSGPPVVLDEPLAKNGGHVE